MLRTIFRSSGLRTRTFSAHRPRICSLSSPAELLCGTAAFRFDLAGLTRTFFPNRSVEVGPSSTRDSSFRVRGTSTRDTFFGATRRVCDWWRRRGGRSTSRFQLKIRAAGSLKLLFRRGAREETDTAIRDGTGTCLGWRTLLSVCGPVSDFERRRGRKRRRFCDLGSRRGLGLRRRARPSIGSMLTTQCSGPLLFNQGQKSSRAFQPGAEVQSSVSRVTSVEPTGAARLDDSAMGGGGAPYIVVERRPRDRGRRGPGVSVSEGAAGSAVEGVEGNERSSRSSLSSEGSCATQGLGASAALLNYTCSSISQSHACALDRDQTVEEIVSVDRSLGVCFSESGGGRRSGWRTDERLTVAALTGFWQRLLLRSNRGFSMRSPRPRNIGGGR